MTTIERTIDVRVPVRTAYNQWTQFESFPYFMEGVDRVIQLDDRTTHWETTVAGAHREFDAEITEQHPDERVAWHTIDGPRHGGVVTFHRLDEHSTRVSLQMEFEPDGVAEAAGAALGIVGGRISGDLRRFKDYIEEEGHETGAWRGNIDAPPQTAAPERGVASHGVGSGDVAEHDVAEHDVAEHDVAEHDVAEHEVAEHEVAEHDPAVQDNRPIYPGIPGPALPWTRP